MNSTIIVNGFEYEAPAKLMSFADLKATIEHRTTWQVARGTNGRGVVITKNGLRHSSYPSIKAAQAALHL